MIINLLQTKGPVPVSRKWLLLTLSRCDHRKASCCLLFLLLKPLAIPVAAQELPPVPLEQSYGSLYFSQIHSDTKGF